MADVNRILKLDRVYTNLDYLKITLPSDPDWQLSTYKKLVEKQRDMSKQENMTDDPVSVASSLKVGYLFETAFHKSPKETDELLDENYILELEKEIVVEEFDRNTELWTNREVVLAAKVLSAKNPKKHGIKFASDNQMRRVYDIIFEVFRYRTIINDILNNIDFENIYPNYFKMTLLVWLISFDYYRNKFKPRKFDEKEVSSFDTLKLIEIADTLKEIKIQLAASFSKFRIKHCALSLSDMLPRHLRNERFKKSSETVISCWINTFLTSTENVLTVLSKSGLTQMKNSEDLIPETFKMDHLLPYFIHIYPKEKSEFLKKIPLFQKHLLILQERRYCLGPAMLDRTMSANKLCGNVAQTHFTIQTAVAYLASLLFKRKQSLIVYGAAERKNDYYNYFVNLGVQNCKLLTEDFLQSSSNNQLSLDIVSVLATPPNTNTGVTDPVQLVCSKGGDLTLLRAVASLDYTEESSDIPCMQDQRDTLRMAMSKPQVQIVVYETHSRLELENGGMVKAVVEEMNGWAYEKHNMDNYSSVSADDSNKFSTSVETPWRPAVFHPVQIPDKDRFETMILYPDKSIENMEKNHVTGSLYLAAVKRVEAGRSVFLIAGQAVKGQLEKYLPYNIVLLVFKELMTFDANHLIRMAEQRGLFGKPVKGRKQKIPSPIILLSVTNSDEPRVMLKFEQMHVLVPTHAFLQRCANKTLQCPRFGKPYDKTSIPTRWWRISVRHVIKALRKPFFTWTKVQMVRFGKRPNRTLLRLKKVTTSFKPQKTKRIYSCSYICL